MFAQLIHSPWICCSYARHEPKHEPVHLIFTGTFSYEGVDRYILILCATLKTKRFIVIDCVDACTRYLHCCWTMVGVEGSALVCVEGSVLYNVAVNTFAHLLERLL